MSQLNARFATTRWSLVQAAGAGASSEAGHAALCVLCESYWYPLYAFVRRRGLQTADAQEAVQDFFAGVLDGNLFCVADADKGRFHSFLLKAFCNYLSDEGRKQRALKRGGGLAPLSLDFLQGEERFCREPETDETPEAVFDRKWAIAVLDGAIEQLRVEFQKEGREELFRLLVPYMAGEVPSTTYADIATAIGRSETMVKVTAHRLKLRFRKVLRSRVADTVDDGEVDEELRRLMGLISG